MSSTSKYGRSWIVKKLILIDLAINLLLSTYIHHCYSFCLYMKYTHKSTKDMDPHNIY